MENEEKTPEQEADQADFNKDAQRDEKAGSILEQAKAEREALEKVRDEARQEREKLEQLRSDELLSGTAGGRQEPKEPVPDTPKQYAEKVMRGEVGTRNRKAEN